MIVSSRKGFLDFAGGHFPIHHGRCRRHAPGMSRHSKKILGDITDPAISSMGLEALKNIIASEDQKPAARVSLDCPTITAGGRGKRI